MDFLPIFIVLKKKKMRKNNFLTFVFLSLFCFAQELSLEDFLKVVKDFHPLSLKAGYEKEIAYARFLAAHQLFEPRIEGQLAVKNFEQKHYYSEKEIALILPVWYGLEIEGGWMQNTGGRLSNDVSFGKSTFLGASWRLGKFFSDSARYEFQQAKIDKKAAIQRQKLQLNDLFFEAAAVFYQWQKIHYQKKIIDSLLLQNKERLLWIKRSVQLGDRAAIDTLDVLAQIQSFEIEALALEQGYQGAILQMNRFLFDQKQNNIPLDTALFPAAAQKPILENLDFYLLSLEEHPKILENQYKIKAYQIDRRFKIQQFFPQLEMYYHLLNRDFGMYKNFNEAQYGIKLKWPLLFLGSSGKFRMTQYKLKAQEAENTAFAIELENKIKTYHQNVLFLQAQYQAQEKNIATQKALYQAEQKKWRIGESSVFLLNLREVKYLESQFKALELQAKWQESYTKLQQIIANLN